METICPNVSLEDKRLIAEKVVSQIKDYALCHNKKCFWPIYLCSCGELCETCDNIFCEDCVKWCDKCETSHCDYCCQ